MNFSSWVNICFAWVNICFPSMKKIPLQIICFLSNYLFCISEKNHCKLFHLNEYLFLFIEYSFLLGEYSFHCNICFIIVKICSIGWIIWSILLYNLFHTYTYLLR
jgi:hypothetical protein